MEPAINPIYSSSFSDLVAIHSITELRNRRVNLFSLKERYLSAGSLYEFFKAAWPYIEGNMPYVDSWHRLCSEGCKKELAKIAKKFKL